MGQNLANKYRPNTFAEVVGQPLIVEILTNMCKGDLDNRNFLFIGPAGTGKTTSARIVGNMLNAGFDIAPIEIDAASHGGVEDVRDIVQQAMQYPVIGNYKIFILDECHAFSDKAWQAFLKTLESSPAKSVFMFCTTNPEKIPATILSRVQTFQLSKISTDIIYDRLIYVLQSEGYFEVDETELGDKVYTKDAVLFLAKYANGGMRDALTSLDKIISYNTLINTTNLSRALNLPAYDDYFILLSAIAKKDNKAITEIVHRVYNSGINFVSWFENFHQFVINIVKFIFLQDIQLTMIPVHYSDKIKNYNQAHSYICLQLANKLIKLIQELKLTNYQQEIALTYLCVAQTKR